MEKQVTNPLRMYRYQMRRDIKSMDGVPGWYKQHLFEYLNIWEAADTAVEKMVFWSQGWRYWTFRWRWHRRHALKFYVKLAGKKIEWRKSFREAYGHDRD